MDLRGHDRSGRPLTSGEVISGLLASFGITEQPADSQGRIGLWRRLVAGQRVLLLLDNVRSFDQIEDLFCGPGRCLVMVTSRDRLSGVAVRYGAQRVTVGRFSADDSMDLLGQALGPRAVAREAAAAQRLVELCDGSPLALRIAAEQISAGSKSSIGALVAQLEPAEHRLDALEMADDPLCSVRSVLSWSTDALDEEELHIFCLMGGAGPGGTITVRDASALAGLSEARARAVLRRLSSQHLVEEPLHDTYRMSSLTRLYAAELAQERSRLISINGRAWLSMALSMAL
jgi:hypothetical protein